MPASFLYRLAECQPRTALSGHAEALEWESGAPLFVKQAISCQIRGRLPAYRHEWLKILWWCGQCVCLRKLTIRTERHYFRFPKHWKQGGSNIGGLDTRLWTELPLLSLVGYDSKPRSYTTCGLKLSVTFAGTLYTERESGDAFEDDIRVLHDQPGADWPSLCLAVQFLLSTTRL